MAKKKDKCLCKWKKDEIKERWCELTAIVSDPKFICEKCGHAAARKKWLCKPVKIVRA